MGSGPGASIGTLLGGGDRTPPADPELAAAVLTSFGAGLLSAAPSRSNAVVSPYSVYSVLAMAAIGANGRTADQLASALGGISPDVGAGFLTAIDDAVGAALAGGVPSEGDPRFHDARPMTVRSANSLFVQHGVVVRPEFLDALAGGFAAGVRQVDYAADPEAARQAVNSWVSDRTSGRIGELLDQGTLSRDTVLSLVNALLVTAPWRTPFRVDATPAPFAVVDGGQVGVRYLRATCWCAHEAGESWRSVTIAYRGGGLAMTVVLPHSGVFNEVRSALPEVLTARQSSGTPAGGMVALALPGFAVRTRLSLVEYLRRAGVTDVFDPAAVDLSGIAGDPGDLVATELAHQAVITVDENGTEAAAATAMSTSATGAPVDPVRIVIDRSFLFAVHDTRTGAPLFLGQVIDPTTSPAGQAR